MRIDFTAAAVCFILGRKSFGRNKHVEGFLAVDEKASGWVRRQGPIIIDQQIVGSERG